MRRDTPKVFWLRQKRGWENRKWLLEVEVKETVLQFCVKVEPKKKKACQIEQIESEFRT